jgi:hypothetical protein
MSTTTALTDLSSVIFVLTVIAKITFITSGKFVDLIFPQSA